MMKTRTWNIKLRAWFPPHDPVATAIAALCILREDYVLDLQGLSKWDGKIEEYGRPLGGFPELDENSPGWRRLYFFRNSLRALREIRKVLDRLELQRALANEPQSLRDAFSTLRHEMNTA